MANISSGQERGNWSHSKVAAFREKEMLRKFRASGAYDLFKLYGLSVDCFNTGHFPVEHLF